MNEEFITFEKFNDQNSAKELGELIAEQNIEFVLVDNSLSFDPTFANNGFGKEYCIKLKKNDFEKANKILAEKSENETNEIDNDYYLLSFTDDELIEVITKSDEWNKFDISLAKKLLKDKGKEITPEKIEEIKRQRIIELSKPEEGQKGYIILGYITAFLGGLLGIFIGWHLLTYKKTLPNGNRIYAYSENDRKQGNRILTIGYIFLAFWLLVRILI
ncbi:hypothetical protein [Flavobacterium turcicum]|uniref:DUF2007 domain-containing protein n=1 Tax=Flavobacterium turcicum TaxID=2764718 RepID=A0ABR7JHQ8_9FLAO|nr:hypothetical protein [Flavobacterium turcicum]MBC5864028.1 hypothetical protein [Flavobacterium turcicum]NHL02794.1 hypothetical protein [Flavobacterium turcicum]